MEFKIKSVGKKWKMINNIMFQKEFCDLRKIIFSKYMKVTLFFLLIIFIYSDKINILLKFIADYNYNHNFLNYSIIYDEYDENIDKKYKYFQNYFCENQDKNFNKEFEKRITKTKYIFNGKNFDIYVYKDSDLVSSSIIKNHHYEGYYEKKILKALEFYSKKKGIENKDIYFLDIGANIGCHSFFFGNNGYKILSFEANKINNYILYKNYCLNKNINITIINKGLDEEDKICKLKIAPNNRGDGTIFCENREPDFSAFNGDIFNNIELTKLSRYMKFFSDKNLAVMKIDVEGYEGKIIKGGKEIISEYHVPFIMMEFSVKLLKLHQTDILEFLQIFENNGYKFSLVDFLSKKYISPEKLMKKKSRVNVFIFYEKFLK